jgi:hypothetical protein
LYDADALAHEEAIQSGGLLKVSDFNKVSLLTFIDANKFVL